MGKKGRQDDDLDLGSHHQGVCLTSDGQMGRWKDAGTGASAGAGAGGGVIRIRMNISKKITKGITLCSKRGKKYSIVQFVHFFWSKELLQCVATTE